MKLGRCFVRFSVCILLGWLESACSAELDESNAFASAGGGDSFLSVSVNNNVLSKSFVSAASLPDGAQLGVFLRSDDGTYYDGAAVDNSCYTAVGDGEGQTWEGDAEHPVRLSATVGTACAYYPWQSSALTSPKVPISADGTDWLYSERPVTGLSNKNANAQFTMVHAMALIRCRLVKGNYYDPGAVSALSVASSGLATQANMDLQQAKLTDFTGVGSWLEKAVTGSLGAEALTVDLWAVPTGDAAGLVFRVLVDGNLYEVTTPDLLVEQGRIYAYTLTLHSKVLELSSVSIEAWSEVDKGDSSTTFTDTWDIARMSDGVYAIDQYGDPVPYAEAKADSYAGVAFVLRGVAYQVAKVDATGSDGSDQVYFWKSGSVDIVGIKNYYYLDEVCNNGWLDGATNPQLSHNPVDWTYGAISDFQGLESTALFVQRQSTDGVPNTDTMAEVLYNFCGNNACNEGYSDWFVPSCAQLAFVYLNRAAIEDLLRKVGGSAFSEGYYWSSSRHRYSVSWVISLATGNVKGDQPYYQRYCRLIRKL